MKQKTINTHGQTRIQIINAIKGPLHLRVLAMMALACLALSALTPAMAAVESNEVGPAIGRMPVIATVDNLTGSTGHPAFAGKIIGVNLTTTVTWSGYSDADGDVEGTHGIEWLLNGTPVAGATGSSYTPPVDAGGKTLQARITPRSVAGDPIAGTPKLSPSVVIEKSFTKPDATARTWSQANTFCTGKGGGYRLPTKQELIDLYVRRTGVAVGTTSYNMCNIHGWPLSGRCGGSLNGYWASESGGGSFRWYVNLNDGGSNIYEDHYVYMVTCVR